MAFNDVARRFFKRLQVTGAYAPNGRTDVEIQNTGYLAEVNLIVTINYTITLGGGTATFITGRGKLTGNPTPWDLIQRIQLNNNQNVPLIDLSGWGLYLFNRTLRSVFDAGNQRAGVQDYNPFYVNATGNAVTGTIRLPIRIPIAYKKSLQAGLIFLQDQQTNMRVSINWGSGTIFTLAGGATAAINSVNVEAEQVHFMTLPNPEDQPSTAAVHRVVEQFQDIVSVGEFRYKVPLSGNKVLHSMLAEFISNGAGLTEADISNISLRVAGSDTIIDTSAAMTLFRQQELLAQPLPRGAYFLDFDSGLGVREFGDSRDLLDLSQITTLELLSTIAPGTTIASAGCRVITESLEYA